MQTVIYAFMGSLNGGSDGSNPLGSIVFTAPSSHNGKIYGTTQGGGRYGGGTVYQLSRPTQLGSPWTETILYNFGPGVEPFYGVIAGTEGRLYGTTMFGGRYNSGTVFSLSPPAQLGGTWTERVLYSFEGNLGSASMQPSGLVLGPSGSLYGTTFSQTADSAGTAFQLSPPSSGDGPWTETVLYAFSAAGGGLLPSGGLILDSAGALYGVALEGGLYGGGIVYQLAPPAAQGGTWTENVLYSFGLGNDSSFPLATLAFDSVGALYGVSENGGGNPCSAVYNGCGTAFKLSPPSIQGGAWTEQVLHTFTGGSDGAWFQGMSSLLVMGTNVFGTTLQGGTGFCEGQNGPAGCGTVFEITQP